MVGGNFVVDPVTIIPPIGVEEWTSVYIENIAATINAPNSATLEEIVFPALFRSTVGWGVTVGDETVAFPRATAAAPLTDRIMHTAKRTFLL